MSDVIKSGPGSKKYVLVIIDGAADYPIRELADKTPLQVARKPQLDLLTARGKYGVVKTVPEGYSPGSDVAIMSLLGYDPATYYTGRAPLEAAAQNLPIKENEWVFRCNLVMIENGIMKDHSAANIPTVSAEKLIALLNEQITSYPVRFYSGVSYRNLMFYEGDLTVTTTPPHDMLEKPIKEFLPQGQGGPALLDMINQSQSLFEPGRLPEGLAGTVKANSIWLWGQGKAPRLSSFYTRFGVRGAVITAVDLVRGIGNLIDWDIINVQGATAYFDTNYQGKGDAAIAALETHELVVVHIEAPDEAGHEGNYREKIHSLEQIDKFIIGPLAEHLTHAYADGWRMLVMPDHPTPCVLRTHVAEAVPFCLAGSDIKADPVTVFAELQVQPQQVASMNIMRVERGHELMELFIGSDLA